MTNETEQITKEECDFKGCKNKTLNSDVVYISGEYKERHYCNKHKYIIEDLKE